jgi:hypothetical protein
MSHLEEAPQDEPNDSGRPKTAPPPQRIAPRLAESRARLSPRSHEEPHFDLGRVVAALHMPPVPRRHSLEELRAIFG